MTREIPEKLKERITEAKKWMFNNGQKEVSRRSGLAESTVSRMFNLQLTPTTTFLDAMIEVESERRRRFDCDADMKVAS